MKTHDAVCGRPVRTGVAATALALVMCTAAAAEDFVFTPIDEIPEGQGLITDESGEFSIFKWSRDKAAQPDASNERPQPAPAQTITSTSGITEAPTPE